MDFDNLNLKDSRIITIKNPLTGEDSDMTVEIYGFHSDFFKKLGSDMYEADPEIKFDEALGLELLAKATKNWTNAFINGKSIEPTEKNFLKWYTEYPWFKDDVESAAGSYQDFFG